MAGRGPAPTPTAILKARGSWLAKTRPDEPKPERSLPTCPSWLPKEAKTEWNRIVPELDKLGLLTAIDRAALAAYCQAWSDFREAVEGDSLRDRDTAAKRLINAAAQFGLSPAARARVQAAPKDKNAKEGIKKYFG